MRTATKLALLALLALALCAWGAWALIDGLRDAVVRIDGTTMTLADASPGELVLAALAVGFILFVALLVVTVVLPVTLAFALGIGALTLVGLGGVLLWPLIVIALLAGWLAYRERPRRPGESAGEAHPPR